MSKLLLSAALGLLLAGAAGAQPMRSELSSPIVSFTPVIVKNAEALALTPEQKADLKNWTATMPAKRKALEAEAISLRGLLRDAIVSGAPQAERQALAEQVGDAETRLVMMRSACTDHWRGVLTQDQFAMLLDLAVVK